MVAKVARWLLLAVPIVGVAEVGAHFWFRARPPTFSEWENIREPVLGLGHLSAPVIAAPAWASPMVRKALGDERMPLAQVAHADMDRFERAIEVSILGERSGEVSGWIEESKSTYGKFTFRVLKNPSYKKIVTDFVEILGPRAAEVFTTDPYQTCRFVPNAQTMSGNLGGNPTFPAQRFECAGGPFFNVGVTVIADEEFRPRRCLWSHPPRNGELVTQFRDVALGSTIVGHGGLYWMIEREKKGAPIELSIRVDGEEVGRVTHKDGQGWARFEIPLGVHSDKQHAQVEFGVSSKNHLHRHFCFEARSQ